ncbi:MAG: type II toxin-antitoxin system RelE/ParE family toxin [Bacteroidetes bacterium]|nr:type II toxin-antitoxin system RelE/ParE family toxin [Bacteroidota bacterium]
MEFEIENKELLKLYKTGKSRKYRLQPAVLEKFFMRIQQIEAALTIYDIWNNPSLNFESLKGTNRYSIRVDRKYRLEFEIDWHNEESTIGKFIIKELSKHYGD